MKKLLCLVLVLGLTVSVTASCKDKIGPDASKPESSSVAGDVTLYVKGFGAKGDGTTDDYRAVEEAIREARKNEGTTVVRFEKDATYLLATKNINNTAMSLKNIKDVKLIGENTTIMIDNMISYATVQNAENIMLKGLNFKFKTLPYTIAKVKAVDKAALTVDIETRDTMGIEGIWESKNEANFGIIDVDTGRLHVFYQKVQVLDAGKNQYRLFCKAEDSGTDRVAMLAGLKHEMFIPIPEVGQMNGSALPITGTENVILEDINMWSASHFTFHFRDNRGEFLIRNVNMVPEPGTYEKMVSWRDGFHLKENRAKFTWENCRLTGAYDDIFNFSASGLNVVEVISDTEFIMESHEFGTNYPTTVEVGDEITVYNPEMGDFCGRTKITEVVKQGRLHIKVETPLKKLIAGKSAAAIDSLSAPDNIIKNCYIDGTFRFRSSVKIYDSEFKITYSWVENEFPWEGPIPKDILFKNCKLYGLTKDATFMSLGAVSTTGVVPEYGVERMVFEDCDVNPEKIYIREGTDVKFIKDGKVVFQKP